MNLSEISNRVLLVKGEWFFIASEGNIGPYCSRKTTERAIVEFIEINSEKDYPEQLQYLSQHSLELRERMSRLDDGMQPTATVHKGKPISPTELQISRAGETTPPPPRTERFFRLDDWWYFSKRGGGMEGPFDSLSTAEIELGCLKGKSKTDTWEYYDYD